MKNLRRKPHPFGLIITIFALFVIVNSQVDCQTFPAGIFGMNEPLDFATNTNEHNLLTNLGANYIFGCVLHQDELMRYCRGTPGSIYITESSMILLI